MGKSRDNYDNVVAWCVDNVPMAQFDTYDDWLEECETQVQTPALFESDTFLNKMQSAWESSGHTTDDEQEEYEDSYIDEQDDFEEPAKPRYEEIVTAPSKVFSKSPIAVTPLRDTTERSTPTTSGAPVVTTVSYSSPSPPPRENRVVGFFKRIFGRGSR